VFAELRRAINAIAGIAAQANPVTTFVRVRVRTFALLLGFGFLAMASLLLSALIAGFARYAGHRWPALTVLATLIDWVVSGALLTVAFAALLRWLPDRPPRHRGLMISALVSALLFTLGKNLIGLYLARVGVASSYGAAGSFVVVMLWVHYSSQIMLFGAACGYADEALRLGPVHGPADAVPACTNSNGCRERAELVHKIAANAALLARRCAHGCIDTRTRSLCKHSRRFSIEAWTLH
jgi:membrane protein